MKFLSPADAAQAQDSRAVITLVESGHSVDSQDNDGNTALHWSSWFKLQGLTEELVERGARPDAVNQSKEAPVHWAAKAGGVAALDIMTQRDQALLSLRDCDGFTPFIVSAQIDNVPVMEWMYLRGVSVEEQDNCGRTALHWACYKGHRKAVQWLLSRSANISHQDLEGMTAIHWAALKGHEQVAEMLLDVGAVHLVCVRAASGDTPLEIAVQKRRRYLVASFLKCKVLQFIIGRPYLSRNTYASNFVCFVSINIAIFAFILAPGIADKRPGLVVCWSLLMGIALMFWVHNVLADPGWLKSERTIQSQNVVLNTLATFDAERPAESQMAHYSSLPQEECSEGAEALAHLELEQRQLNLQRQLIAKARQNMDESAELGTTAAELQPLIHAERPFTAATAASRADSGAPPLPPDMQLRNASLALRERERAAGESAGRLRKELLRASGGSEYLAYVERGDFREVCVICRACRTMRSHHCKECGRCVDRLDHHCPWIDNCVGLGNQRSFYGFVVLLFAAILLFYDTVGKYFLDAVVPAIMQGSLTGFFHSLSRGSLRPTLEPLIVLVSVAFNCIWLVFVGALVVRHSAYMAVNITTYEVLVRPPHVQRRFPRADGRFWFLRDLGFKTCLQHCLTYWTLDTKGDAEEFAERPHPRSPAAAGVGTAGGVGYQPTVSRPPA